MTQRVTIETLIELVDGDREFVQLLITEGVVVAGDDGFSPEDVDSVLVSHTLFQGLGVNMPGVEIILRLRRDLVEARRRLQSLSGRVTHASDDDNA